MSTCALTYFRAQCDDGWIASDLLQSVLSVNVSFISGRYREVSGQAKHYFLVVSQGVTL